jgi:hypothetical protein
MKMEEPLAQVSGGWSKSVRTSPERAPATTGRPLPRGKRRVNNIELKAKSKLEILMKLEQLYHKCGHSILLVKKSVGPAQESFFIDGANPFLEGKAGARHPNVINKCPGCSGFLKIERLLSQKPEISEEKAPSGYIPAKFSAGA